MQALVVPQTLPGHLLKVSSNNPSTVNLTTIPTPHLLNTTSSLGFETTVVAVVLIIVSALQCGIAASSHDDVSTSTVL
jgi:hypothetical protein